MIRVASRSNWRSLIVAVTALLLASCSTTRESPREATTSTDQSSKNFRQWEESTRDLADDLMDEAQRLQVEGRRNEAIALSDEALCVVLEIPEGYSPGIRYLDYLAELIDEGA